ncbi:unnamed protein product, partial [Ectocarpus sp. 4 AP-2014]
PELKLTAATGPPPLPLGRGRAGAGAGPGVPVSPPPPPPPDRPAGVRSRAWWRCMVVADDGGGGFETSGSRVVSMGRRKSSVAVGRRKVPHAATTTTTASSPNGGGNGSGDRIRVPLERLKRAVVAGPNTLIVDLEVEEAAAGGRAWRPATLVVGPCDAPRLGSLLVERALTAIPRRSLGQVVRRARKLASKPPPLPPRPSAKGLGSNSGGGSGAAVVRATAAAPAPPKAEGSWQSDPGKLAAKEGTGGSNNNPFGPKTPPAAAPTTNSFGSGGAALSSSPPPLPRRSGSPFQSREAAATAVVVAASSASSSSSPRRGGGGPPVLFSSSLGASPAAAGPLEAVLGEAVGLLQQAGRAVASLDDAYNAAYNASAAADGWGGQGHDVAELGEAVLWTLWSRLVRLHAYLRQLLAETPAQKLQICAAVKRKDWGVLVGCIDTEAAHQRSAVLSEIEAEAEEAEDEDSPARPSGPGRALQGSMKAVKGLCGALDRMVTEMLLCADTVPESMLRRAVEVLASQCYIKVVDEVGRHITFRYEGVLPLADQELLALLDVLVNKADLIERTLQPRLDLVGWRSSPPPLLTKAVSVPWLLRAYATSIEGKLSGLFRNVLDTNKETHEFPPEPSATSDQEGEGTPQSKSPTSNALMRMKLAGRGVGVGGTKSKQRRQQQQQQQLGFSMWALHESTAKPLSVVPTTAIALLDTYVVTVAKRFPDDAGVQAVILRAGAGALGSLRNVISAHAEAAVSQCPEKGWDKLLRFLCATANDCWHLVSEALPAIEERHPQAMSEGAEESYETLKELWVLLGVSCCRKAARLVLGFMEADGLFALEGIHVAGAEESMVEIREALEYYCINFLRPWLEEYFYQKVLVRLCDHIVVWAAQGLVRAATAGRPPLHSGQMLRLEACRETLAEALKTCSVRKGGDVGDGGGEGGAGGGMYERRLAFLDDLLELLRVPSDQLEGVFNGMLGRHIHCQRSVQHALQVVLCLRADGSTVPGGVAKWADEDNWMGGDAIVLTADTAEIEPFHRVFRRPLSLLRADPTPLVAPTVLNRASDGGRRQSAAPLPSAKEATHDTGNPSAGGGGGGGGGWAKRGLTFAGSGGLGIALGGGDGGGATSGVKKGMAKLKKGLRKASTRGGSKGGGGGAAAVAMSGVGVDDSGPQTILRVTILEAEGLRNVAVLKKTDSYVAAELVTRTGRREGRTALQK